MVGIITPMKVRRSTCNGQSGLDRVEPFLETSLLEPEVLGESGDGGELADGDQLRTLGLLEWQHQSIATDVHKADLGPAVGGERQDFRRSFLGSRDVPLARTLIADELSCRPVVEQEDGAELFAEYEREGFDPIERQSASGPGRSFTKS